MYDLKQVVAMSVGNFWSVPHSQLYREAERLEEANLLARRDDPSPGGRARKVYALTEVGRDALARWRDDAEVGRLPELRDPGLLKLFFGADPAKLGAARLAAHRQQLDSYRQRLATLGGDGPEGPRLTLEAGIAHEIEWVRFWEKLSSN